MTIHEATTLVKEEAYKLGFAYCGISKAGFLEEEAPRLEQWLSQGMHGSMMYMERHFDKRLDPTKLVEGAKSIISLLLNYYPEKKQNPEAPKISKYAYGKTDYHTVIKNKLSDLLLKLREHLGQINGRGFVDSAPVLDRAWAAKSGLGWIGKNGNLISPKAGSWFFIAELIVDVELEPDAPIKDFCGTCTRCIDACPTEAIIKPKVVDGSKCISYFTIELKNEIPVSFQNKFNGWMFGCDICQDVCPWNRFSKPHKHEAFEPNENMLSMNVNEWQEITEALFNNYFKNTALSRTGYTGMMRNLKFLEKTNPDELPS
jgi:epoxyqueuosine reductase